MRAPYHASAVLTDCFARNPMLLPALSLALGIIAGRAMPDLASPFAFALGLILLLTRRKAYRILVLPILAALACGYCSIGLSDAPEGQGRSILFGHNSDSARALVKNSRQN